MKVRWQSSSLEIGESSQNHEKIIDYNEDEDEHSEEYYYTYNSDVLLEEQLTWLGNVRAVGRNPQSKRCYISGEATEIDDSHGLYVGRGDHPHAPVQDDCLDMYHDGIPVHDQCLYSILPKVLAYKAGSGTNVEWPKSSISDIDLDHFYACVEQVLPDSYGKVLRLHYYEAQEMTTEQCWDANRGQEALVADPLNVPQLRDYYMQLPTLAPCSIDSEQYTAPSMEKESVKAITLSTSAPDSTWKQRLTVDMPWLWDFPVDQNISHIDWKQVYSDMDRRSTFGSPDAISGLVNRRRIWSVCHQLAVPYVMKVSPVVAPSLDDIDEDIRTSSASPYTPLVTAISDKSTQSSQRVKSLWVRDLPSIGSTSSVLKSYWNTDGYLTGIAIEYENRFSALFGFEASGKDSTKSVIIDRGERIQGFRFFVDRAIQGLQVITTKRTSQQIKDCEFHAHIDLIARPGTEFVGLEGNVPDGIICQIGVLEYTKNHSHLTLSPLSFANRQLWNNSDPFSPPMKPRIEASPYHEGSWIAASAVKDRKLNSLTPVLLGKDGHQTLTSISAMLDLQDIEFHSSAGTSVTCDPSAEGTQMKWFPIKGAEGERVVGVEVEVAELPTALRIVTNWGHQHWFGVPRSINAKRHRYLPKAGHAFAGLYYGSNYYDQKRDIWRLSALSILSAPGPNESPLLFPAFQDSCGQPWESAPPPAEWETSGSILGSSSNANMVTWLDLMKPIDKIEGLVSPPPGMQVFDLDGIRVTPPFDATNTKDSPPVEEVVPDEDIEAFEAWRTEQERSATIGTPPPASYLLSKKRKLRPTAKKFSYPVVDEDHEAAANQKSDEMDGAIAHQEDDDGPAARASDGVWQVPGQKISGISVWAGTYLHGFRFHAASGATSPGWGKCGGKPAARWDIGHHHTGKSERDTCVGLKVFLSNTRGPYRLQELKIVGVQRMTLVSKAVALTRRFAR
ncbi:MAG: hypothetical protein Q9226_003188 [Calogaya cf. arnoldii]